jgi:hypothetical protein
MISISNIPVPPVQPVPVIKLSIDLTQREAEAFRALCRRVGGCPDNSPRKLFSDLESALSFHGVRIDESLINIGDGIYFREWKK